MSAGADNRYTRGIAEFVSGLGYDAIPREVRERAKLLILDSLGCALYGARLPWCRILQRTHCAPEDVAFASHLLHLQRAEVVDRRIDARS